MANTFTSINVAKVESEIVSALKFGLMPLDGVFTMGVGSDPKEKNETVTVPLITARTASSNATNYEDGNTTVTGKVVNLDTNISCSWHISAIEASKQDTDYFAKAAVEAVHSVAQAALVKAFNLVVRASYGTSTEQVSTASAFDSDIVFDMRKTCIEDLKWRDSQKRSLVLVPEYYAGLAKDPAVKDLSASGDRTAQSGIVARHAGFDIYEQGALTTASTAYGATEYVRGFACLKEAMAVAIRPPAMVGNAVYDINQIVTDPDTGISLNWRSWVNPTDNKLWGTVEILMGAIAVDGSALLRLVSQTSS